MLHPSNIEQKLGFDKLKSLVAERCIGDGGRKFALSMRPIFDKVVLQRLLDQVRRYPGADALLDSHPCGHDPHPLPPADLLVVKFTLMQDVQIPTGPANSCADGCRNCATSPTHCSQRHGS